MEFVLLYEEIENKKFRICSGIGKNFLNLIELAENY